MVPFSFWLSRTNLHSIEGMISTTVFHKSLNLLSFEKIGSSNHSVEDFSWPHRSPPFKSRSFIFVNPFCWLCLEFSTHIPATSSSWERRQKDIGIWHRLRLSISYLTSVWVTHGIHLYITYVDRCSAHDALRFLRTVREIRKIYQEPRESLDNCTHMKSEATKSLTRLIVNS